MSNAFRRFEVLLPLQFNDGKPVPAELLAQTFDELRMRFDAVSAETQTIKGSWQHQGEQFTDELVRFFVDVADTPEHIEFFRQFKEALKERFGQLDIWLTTYPIEVI